MDNTKKKRNVPITIVFLCGITGLIVGAFLFGYKTLAMVHSAGNASRIASQIEQIIAEYIREGDGHFPLNEVDLQHRGLISKVDANGMIEYFMNPSPLNNQIPESQCIGLSFGISICSGSRTGRELRISRSSTAYFMTLGRRRKFFYSMVHTASI